MLDWTVAAEGAVFGAGFTDGAGDAVNTMTVQGPVERIEVAGRGDGRDHGHRRRAARPPRDRSRRGSTCSRRAATEPNRALVELGDAALEGGEAERPLDRAHRLSARGGRRDRLRAGRHRRASTTAAEALELGRGVCQDMAHALIALAHAAGMPARYVTGYLLTGEDAEGEAAHAWAEIHVDGLGWIGFDPANRCCPDERYIRLGSGRDAREAAPIRGVSRGGGGEAMDVSVVVSAQQ